MIRTINSIKDPKIKLARDLQTIKGRQDHSRCTTFGEQASQWALQSQYWYPEYLIFDEKKVKNYQNFIESNQIKNISYSVSSGMLKKITNSAQDFNLVGVYKRENPSDMDWGSFVLVLDNVLDHGNLGTILRTAASFSVETIILTSKENDFFSRRTIEASRGKVFSLNTLVFSNKIDLINLLKRRNYKLIVTTPKGGEQLKEINKVSIEKKALVLGNETTGVSIDFTSAADQRVYIPMSQDVESLNVGVAAGIFMYNFLNEKK